MNKKIILAIIVIGGIIGFSIWYSVASKPAGSESENKIISKNGIHWHSELSIIIKGEKQEIPANIGLGAIHLPLHTHETDNIIHMEFSRAVRENDIKLGEFFKIWKKKFDSNCISASGGEFCNNETEKLKMFVNGKENNEFKNYIMKDNDKIEIRYEPR